MDRLTPKGMLLPSVLMLLIAIMFTALAGCGSGSSAQDIIACQRNRANDSLNAQEQTLSDRFIVKLAFSKGADAAPTAVAKLSDTEYVRDLFRHSVPQAMSRQGVESAPEVTSIDEATYAVRLPAETEIAGTLATIGSEPDVEFVEPDYKVHLISGEDEEQLEERFVGNRSPAGDKTATPQAEELASATPLLDPLAGKQWAHQKIGSVDAWKITPGSKKIIVAVIDTGVDYNHPDLKANMWRNPDEIPDNGKDDDGNGLIDDVYGWDYANNDNKPLSNDGKSFHGTHVAGTIGAVGGNKRGITGHSPYVRIMALKFIGASGGYTSDAVKSVNYAVAKGAKILNNSWGSGNVSTALKTAIENARTKGVLFVAAAGNSGNNITSSPMYPAAYTHDNILVVGATDQNDNMPSWSNYSVSRVDIGAPGKQIYSTKNDGAYAFLQGTSMATPLVSGVAALIASVRPDYTYKKIKSTILGTVDKATSLKTKVATGGRINAKRAISSAVKGSPFPILVGIGEDGGGADPCLQTQSES